jgi:hypothetical protein
MMPRWIPNPDDVCLYVVRDKNFPFKEIHKSCGKKAVGVIRLGESNKSARIQLCARHAAELIQGLADAFEEQANPDPDYPPGTEIPLF